MTLENGWSQVESQAVIARERPGPPEPEGAFARGVAALVAFAFSDPRIVRGHFREGLALDARHVLLELKSVGLHYLCPVRVGAVREETEGARSIFGYRFDTLAGHIETGREWFLLTKEHGTGLVRFRIEAAWRPGEFPNWWSRLGFHLLGRRYQRAWHHLAHVRLRELLDEGAVPAHPGAHALVHAPLDFGRHPIFIYSRRAVGRWRSGVEREEEHMRRDGVLATVGLGTLAGMRSMSAPAFLGYRLRNDPERARPGLARVLASRRAGRVLGLLSAGELVADKLPGIPARVAPPALAGRVLSGALVGAAVAARERRPQVFPAVVGALAAIASSFVFFKLRQLATRRLGMPDVAAGLVEDAAVLALGAALVSSLR